MISRRNLLKAVGLGLLAGGLPSVHSQELDKKPLLLAHFMPWYQAPDVSGFWGWHWTMDHYDPTKTNEAGYPEIASHFNPLTGPYDSSDDAILEYQVLLMKISGIDGVIVDWYGIEDFRDYAAVNRSTLKLFDLIKKAGLKFAICYEDQSLKHMINEGLLATEDAHTRGQDVMRFMDEHWFDDDAYVKFEGHPVLFTFGPQYFKSSRDWETLFSVLDNQPSLVTLDKHMVTNALASFPWAPMYGYTVTPEVLEVHFEQFYRKARRWDYIVGGVFPGFYDIYQEAGVRSSYGFLDANGTETFLYTLQIALDQNPDVIQLITWNDYGEGTIIEPTYEFGYQYLEIVQDTRRSLTPEFTYTAEDLQLPLQLLTLRKSEPEQSNKWDEIAQKIIDGDTTAAAESLAAEA